MSEQGFPGQHTTTTTVTSGTTQVQTNVRFDPSYLKTMAGRLKVAQIILDLLGFICIEASGIAFLSRGSWFNFVAMTGFWVSGFLLVFYLFHIIEKFFKIPWLKVEMVFCVVWTGLYLIAAALAAALHNEAYAVAAFFGFCAMVVYGYDGFLKLKGVQAGDLAQGERNVTKQTTTVTTPVQY